MSDRIVGATSIQTLLVASHVSGSAVQLRGQGGVQYDTPAFRFAGSIRTPALTMRRTGTVTLESTLDLGATSLGASAFDANARFHAQTPWELQAGAAYVGDRGEIEVDLHGYTPIGAHPLLSTAEPTLIYGDAGDGGAPAVIPRSFTGVTAAADGVVNVAVGGHVRPVRGRELRVHGGLATNRSPVGDADQVFTKAHFVSWTLGVSGTVAKLRFAVGVNGRVGTARQVNVRTLLSDEPLRTAVHVRTVGFIYSIDYQF